MASGPGSGAVSERKEGRPSVSILFPESDGGIYKIGYSPITKQKVIAVFGVEASANFIKA